MRRILFASAILALAACGDGTSPQADGQVGLGFQVSRSTTTSTALNARVGSPDGRDFTGAAPVTTTTPTGLRITRGTDVIVITKAQLVVRDVKLRRAVAGCDDDDDSRASSIAVDGRSNDRDDDDDDDCPVIRIGPFLVDMPVTGVDGGRVAVPVPEGTYSSVRLRLHKVTSNDPLDAAFRQANPDFRDISVRLEGTFNDAPFVFVSDVNASLDVPLTAPLVVGAGGDDVTVTIDLSLWFLRPQGGLYAPSLANTPGNVRAAVQHNIRNAFRAFRDRDRDGRED
jgi:hypothetical protein